MSFHESLTNSKIDAKWYLLAREKFQIKNLWLKQVGQIRAKLKLHSEMQDERNTTGPVTKLHFTPWNRNKTDLTFLSNDQSYH